MENHIYNWRVKKGNIVIEKNGEYIALQLNYENNESCLLTYSDTHEIIEVLTNIAKQIWENPTYIKKPYTNRLYNTTNGVYVWEIDASQLIISYNDNEDAVEMQYTGNSKFNIEMNYAVEIIQILEHLTM